MADEMKELPLDTVYWPDATDITEEQIRNMAMSIMVHGQIEPIVVATRDEKGYRGVVGRLRYEGIKERWKNNPEGKTVLARIHTFKDDLELKMWQMAENLHRRELPAMQRARQYQEIYELIKAHDAETARLQTLARAIEDMTGNKESTKTIQHYLTLTKLQPKAQEILTSEKLSLRSGLELARIKDPKKQVKVAEKIQAHPDYFENVRSLKWEVDTIVAQERKKRRKVALQKKAAELRSEGKVVVLAPPYSDLSWEEQRKYKRFWSDPFDKCKEGCPNFGIELGGNYQQNPICADRDCYKKFKEEDSTQRRRERQAKMQLLQKEQEQLYRMKPDERHWRLAVVGLIDQWELRELLNVKQGANVSLAEAIWRKVKDMTIEECQRLLIRHAVEHVLTLHAYGSCTPVKEWAVKEFDLTREVFLEDKD
ncbi:MAG: ParB/RepB/Spo0J family partition protein [Candidatus Bathyarchaeia archaeon]